MHTHYWLIDYQGLGKCICGAEKQFLNYIEAEKFQPPPMLRGSGARLITKKPRKNHKVEYI